MFSEFSSLSEKRPFINPVVLITCKIKIKRCFSQFQVKLHFISVTCFTLLHFYTFILKQQQENKIPFVKYNVDDLYLICKKAVWKMTVGDMCCVGNQNESLATSQNICKISTCTHPILNFWVGLDLRL